jgi:hypothetical protein
VLEEQRALYFMESQFVEDRRLLHRCVEEKLGKRGCPHP